MTEVEAEQTRLQRFLANPLVKSFIAYSIFRAFYGMGILIVTYFIATSENNPWWYSLIFLLFSMVFSRLLFRWIKKMRAKEEEPDVAATLDTQSAAADT